VQEDLGGGSALYGLLLAATAAGNRRVPRRWALPADRRLGSKFHSTDSAGLAIALVGLLPDYGARSPACSWWAFSIAAR